MADLRKVKLKKLEKKLISIQEKHADIDLNNMELLRNITEYSNVRREAFYLKFDIEHCSECYQLLPKYKK